MNYRLIKLTINMICSSWWFSFILTFCQCIVKGGERQRGDPLGHHLIWESLSCNCYNFWRSHCPQSLSKYPGYTNEYHEKKLLQNIDFFLLVYFGIIYQLNIFRNYFDSEIQAWNTSHNMSENQEISELNPSSWFFVFLLFFFKYTVQSYNCLMFS